MGFGFAFLVRLVCLMVKLSLFLGFKCNTKMPFAFLVKSGYMKKAINSGDFSLFYPFASFASVYLGVLCVNVESLVLDGPFV